jgi:hypothetical protein
MLLHAGIDLADSNIGIIYICGFCQSNTLQPFGRTQSRETKGGEQKTYKTAQVTVHSSICVECGHVLHVSRIIDTLSVVSLYMSPVIGRWAYVAWTDT